VTALAEKYETIVSKGIENSRLRDYYDIWLLSTSHSHSGSDLAAAITATFAHRETVLPSEVASGLAASFYSDPERQSRWKSFLDTKGVDAPADLAEVCDAIVAFITPPATAAAMGAEFTLTWSPSLGWSA